MEYLYGSRPSEQGGFELVQEGRIGYEEYASKSSVPDGTRCI